MCLNAPAGVTCAFDSATNSVTIQTAVTTPKGAHAITLVFSAQALARNLQAPAFLAMTFSILGLPLGSVILEARRRRKLKAAYWIVPITVLLLFMAGCGGGYGSSGAMQPGPIPQSGQASASVTVTVE